MRVAILALQGAFAEHAQMLARLGAEPVLLRNAEDAARDFDGLILPGGESTVQGKLLRDLGMLAPLRTRIIEGLPTFGTCAGAILLAKEIEGEPRAHFGVMDVTVVRNAYGRQLGSFCTRGDFAGIGKLPMTFIRAPYIKRAAAGVEILAECDGRIVAARQDNCLACAFHPEMNESTAVHAYFLEMIRAFAAKKHGVLRAGDA